MKFHNVSYQCTTLQFSDHTINSLLLPKNFLPVFILINVFFIVIHVSDLCLGKWVFLEQSWSDMSDHLNPLAAWVVHKLVFFCRYGFMPFSSIEVRIFAVS